MKILACTDGSEHSRKTMQKASEIATGCNASEVAIIHVDELKRDFTILRLTEGYPPTEEAIASFKRGLEEHKAEIKMFLSEALKVFEEKNIMASIIFKQGHPAKTILEVASEQRFDMIIIGSRGLSSWQSRILGSVSGAVVQEAKDCTVVVVK